MCSILPDCGDSRRRYISPSPNQFRQNMHHIPPEESGGSLNAHLSKELQKGTPSQRWWVG